MEKVGNLSSLGIGIYMDENLNIEARSPIITDSEQVLYLGLKTPNGSILILEEDHQAYMIDLISTFRDYSGVENMRVDVSFDARGFMRNMLLDMINKPLYQVLEFISISHMDDSIDDMIMCSCEPNRDKIISCHSSSCDEWRYVPIDEYGFRNYPSNYQFFNDFFIDPDDLEKVSQWKTWISDGNITRMLTDKYTTIGYHNGGQESYNYINNIYPSHIELLDYRWNFGGYDITEYELKKNKTHIYNKFYEWYSGSMNGYKYAYIADEKTVLLHTGIAKTETKYIFERDENILEELLGPKHCSIYDAGGICSFYGYGDSEIGDQNTNELQENIFNVIYNPDFLSLDPSYIVSDEYGDLCKSTIGLSPDNAFYSMEYTNGVVGGQTIYNNGIGNEYRYFMPFEKFLNEQGWTIDDFMSIYSHPISQRIVELNKGVFRTAIIATPDYSEFYDKEHRSPFAGISYYTPLCPSKENIISVSKKKATYNQDGTSTIESVGTNNVSGFIDSINKDEFVDSVVVKDALRILITGYTTIKITITPNNKKKIGTNLRMYTNDFTFLSRRKFNLHG